MAEFYEAKAHPFTTLFAQEMLARMGDLSGKRVLDVATGAGAASLLAAAQGAHVVAVDYSEGMLDKLRRRKVAAIDARQMNGESLSLTDSSFDAVFSVFGVMMFDDWHAGLREMFRVTKPGGQVAVVTWNSPEGTGFNLLLGRVCREIFPDLIPPCPPGGMLVLADPKRLSEEMIAAGFERPTVGTIAKEYPFQRQELRDLSSMFARSAWAQMLTAEQQATAMREVSRRFEEGHVDGVFCIRSEALIAWTTRAVAGG